MADGPNLSIVIPVYNEQEAAGSLVAEWTRVVDALGIDYEMRVYDDGSRDATPEVIGRCARENSRVLVFTHPNRGHGPTLMRGYTEARGEWVFQTDGDGELPAEAFPALWAARNEHDFVIGRRANRRSPFHRRLLTAASRMLVALLFGRAARDVNSPYRLMRGSWLRAHLPLMATDHAVPNLALAGLAARSPARVLEIDVPHLGRRAGATSLNVRRLSKLVLRAANDLWSTARRARA